MTPTLDIPTLIFIIVEIATLVFAITRDDYSGGGYIDFGSTRDWAIVLWVVLSIIAVLIFGGIFWW